MAQNFWYWILQGLIDIANSVFLGPMPVHIDWGITALFVGNTAVAVVLIIAFFGAFIRLSSLAIVFGLIVTLETIRMIYAIYRWVVGLIPLP